MSTQPERKFKIPGNPLVIELDPDVKAVLAFMLLNFEGTKLVSIANTVQQLAEPFFGRFKAESFFHGRFIPIEFSALPLHNEDN